MAALVASFLAMACAFGYIMAASASPSMREAIRRVDQSLEEKYFSSLSPRHILVGRLKIVQAFRSPPTVLANSSEFMGALRLVRVFLIVAGSSASALVAVVVFT